MHGRFAASLHEILSEEKGGKKRKKGRKKGGREGGVGIEKVIVSLGKTLVENLFSRIEWPK